MPVRRPTLLLVTLLLLAPLAQGQKMPAKPAEPPPTPDILVFTNGDQLTGKLESAAGGSVVFASDMAGSLTVSFDKIKEIRSGSKSAEFAVLKKGVPVNKNTPAPEGTVTLANGNVLVHRGLPAANTDSTVGPASVPVKEVSYIVAKQEFDHQVAGKHGFKEGWNGTLTGGATLVRSTTSATTLTGALSLIRALPTVSWLPARNRTTLNIVETYGKNTSPGAIPQTVPPTPSVTTLSSIFHADSERDEYFTARFYALADVAFDHNYAQGLSFQQIYGGGVGWTPIKTGKQQLDVKADLHYQEQQFDTSLVDTPSMNIIGSTIFEGYRRTLPRKMIFTETANILPAFNNSNAYSANVTAAVAIPVFKRLSASVSTTDNYLNDPSPGYNKNSYQFVTGVTYALK
jgi:hypothetical protein